MFFWLLMNFDLAKERKDFLTQRAQQHRDHALDAPSPSAEKQVREVLSFYFCHHTPLKQVSVKLRARL